MAATDVTRYLLALSRANKIIKVPFLDLHL